MLRSIRKMEGHTIAATDGEIGKVHDILFDDRHWTVRFLVVDTGTWLTGRRVLISPVAFSGVDWQTGNIELRLTRDQIETSPDVDTEKPVSRQHEREHFRHFGWPFYWGGTNIWGVGVTPSELAIAAEYPGVMPAAAEEREGGLGIGGGDADRHLRSAREMMKYRLEAMDGTLGNVNDLLIDDEGWNICYLAVGTGEWFVGEHVLLSPKWIERVNLEQQKVYTDLTREEVRRGPVWDSRKPMDRDFERHLHRHLQRPGYWADEDRPLAP